ncbi:MAG: helix-turn-helix transcriptional regulator [Methanobrevibacter sp.]|nr:helix-turn-helix transcriptional regulator [Methanobrevibacter sp.]
MKEFEEIRKSKPLLHTIKILNKKWLLLIMRDFINGKKHFNEFKEDKPELTNHVLSNCLKTMEDEGLIFKINNEETKHSTEYVLTEKGFALYDVIYEIAIFAAKYDERYITYDEETKNLKR